MTAPVVLEAGEARVELAPGTGGAIAAFQWQGRDVLRPTSTADRDGGDVRQHASYPLVPYSNRIARACLAFEGATHDLDRNFGDHPHAIHGVGWQRPWRVEAAERSHARLAFDHDPAASEAGRRAWPWPFRATQSFVLRPTQDGGATLALKLALTNTGTSTFPCGLGWHPYFVRSAASSLGFRAEGVWLTDATILPTQHVVPPAAMAFDPPRTIGATTLDNVYTGWDGTVTLDDPGRNLRVTVTGDTACPYLVVYIPAQPAAFLAIEPVTQMTDAFNRLARGERTTGTRLVAPGASFSAAMEITAGALA